MKRQFRAKLAKNAKENQTQKYGLYPAQVSEFLCGLCAFARVKAVLGLAPVNRMDMPAQSDKALILFARYPRPGSVKTRLSPPFTPEEAAALYRCMLLDTIAAVSRLDTIDRYLFYVADPDAVDYFRSAAKEMTSLPQCDGDLGERMAGAFRLLFGNGYREVAIIGSDAPDLPEEFIAEAFQSLDDGTDAVFGPAGDGGYYLLAMKQLREELFREIPWSSGEVLGRSQKVAEENGLQVALLPLWHDLDTVEDLLRPELLKEETGAPLTREFVQHWTKNRGR